MRQRINRLLYLLSLLALVSCGGTLFHRYEQVDDMLWGKSDTIEFLYNGSEPGSETGVDATLEIRHDAGYDNRYLLVRMEVVDVVDNCIVAVDTFLCEVYDDYGRRNGSASGGLYQLSGNSLPLPISSKDTVLVRLSHIMEQETLDGIADVGIKFVGSSAHGQHQF